MRRIDTTRANDASLSVALRNDRGVDARARCAARPEVSIRVCVADRLRAEASRHRRIRECFVAKHDDAVGVNDCGKSMCDHEERASPTPSATTNARAFHP
jgi:hypothetical protein